MNVLDAFNAWYATVPVSNCTHVFVVPDTTVIEPTALNDTLDPEMMFTHATKLPDSCNVVLYPLSDPFKS
jgi:hypothetical protein